MVATSAITIATDGERLTCGGFSLSETVHLGILEFIADYFCGLSLSPRRGNSGAAFMGSTHSGRPSPQRAMIEDSTEEFLTASSMEGCFDLPSPKRHDTGFPPSPITTTVDDDVVARYRPPFRATPHSSKGAASAGLSSAAHH
jgi:hypothetical protein